MVTIPDLIGRKQLHELLDADIGLVYNISADCQSCKHNRVVSLNRIPLAMKDGLAFKSDFAIRKVASTWNSWR